MSKGFSHVDPSGNPAMVDVGDKAVTERIATAGCVVTLPQEVIARIEND